MDAARRFRALSWPLHTPGEVDSLSLQAVAARLGVERGQAHRALDDARTALEVARSLLRRFG